MDDIVSIGAAAALIFAFILFVFKEFLKELIKKCFTNLSPESAKKIAKRVSIFTFCILLVTAGFIFIPAVLPKKSQYAVAQKECDAIKNSLHEMNNKYREAISKYSKELNENRIEKIVLTGYQSEIRRYANFSCDSLKVNDLLIQSELDIYEVELEKITNKFAL